MSDSKYQADITKGIALSAGGLYRFSRWPAAIPGLGPSVLGTFGRCEDCPPAIHISVAGTWSTFGGRRLCEGCADRRAKAAAA